MEPEGETESQRQSGTESEPEPEGERIGEPEGQTETQGRSQRIKRGIETESDIESLLFHLEIWPRPVAGVCMRGAAESRLCSQWCEGRSGAP